MKFFLLNLLAASILITAALVARAWIGRRPNKTSMKKLLSILALSFLIISCKKSVDRPAPASTKVPVKFFSSNAVVSTKVITFKVFNTNYGRVTYASGTPVCEASGFVTISMEPGTYTAQRIDESNSAANRDVSFTVAAGSKCQFFDLK